MNAFRMYDAIEERKWVQQNLKEEKEKWVDDRAQELIAMFPESPLEMRSMFLSADACKALCGSEAEEIYSNYISDICYARAYEEWQRNHPLMF